MLPLIKNVFHNHSVGRRGSAANPTQHRHEFSIICCIIRGGGRYQLGPDDFNLQAPAISLLPAGERDGNGLVGPYESFWCSFQWEGIRAAGGGFAEVTLPEGHVRRKYFRRAGRAELRRPLSILRNLQLLARRPDLRSRLLASAAILELLAIWAQPPGISAGSDRSVILYRNLIEQYADDPRFSLSAIADRVGISSAHLGVLFRHEMGMTPVAYREQLRIARAKEMLASTNLSIREVARDAGYPDANYFTRVFRKVCRMSPRAFARQKVM